MFSVESVAVRNSSASDCQVTRIRAVTLSIFFSLSFCVSAHARARVCVSTCAYVCVLSVSTEKNLENQDDDGSQRQSEEEWFSRDDEERASQPQCEIKIRPIAE